jgi:hypothetical protein
MPDFSLVEEMPSHRYEVAKSNTTNAAQAISQTGAKSWQIEVIAIIVGVSALVFFIALGGAFALLGPGVIYMGILSIRKRAGLGRQLLRIMTAVALGSLSLGALLGPVHTSSWCIGGSILGLFTGTMYLVLTLLTVCKICTVI